MCHPVVIKVNQSYWFGESPCTFLNKELYSDRSLVAKNLNFLQPWHRAVGHHEDGLDAQRHARHNGRRVTQRSRQRLSWPGQISVTYLQACKLKFRLGKLTSCSCSVAALAVCFEGRKWALSTYILVNKLAYLAYLRLVVVGLKGHLPRFRCRLRPRCSSNPSWLWWRSEWLYRF